MSRQSRRAEMSEARSLNNGRTNKQRTADGGGKHRNKYAMHSQAPSNPDAAAPGWSDPKISAALARDQEEKNRIEREVRSHDRRIFETERW